MERWTVEGIGFTSELYEEYDSDESQPPTPWSDCEQQLSSLAWTRTHPQMKEAIASFWESQVKAVPGAEYVKPGVLVACNVLSPAECERIIEITQDCEDWLDGKVEPVDGNPEYQVNLFGTKQKCRMCRKYSETRMHPLTDQHPELSDALVRVAATMQPLIAQVLPPGVGCEMHRAFVKRYRADERIELCTHRDGSLVTANLLLSRSSAFSDGGAYVYSRQELNSRIKELQGEESLRRHAVIHLEQGDAVLHPGKLLHGAYPISGGERYILALFYGLIATKSSM